MEDAATLPAITDSDLVPGAVFIRSAFADTISGLKFAGHYPILIKPRHEKYPDMVYFFSISIGGRVGPYSRLSRDLIPRLHRPTAADEALVTKLRDRAQAHVQDLQRMIDALAPFSSKGKPTP